MSAETVANDHSALEFVVVHVANQRRMYARQRRLTDRRRYGEPGERDDVRLDAVQSGHDGIPGATAAREAGNEDDRLSRARHRHLERDRLTHHEATLPSVGPGRNARHCAGTRLVRTFGTEVTDSKACVAPACHCSGHDTERARGRLRRPSRRGPRGRIPCVVIAEWTFDAAIERLEEQRRQRGLIL